jgi:ADP-heptose:LPS heptosyltransferase
MLPSLAALKNSWPDTRLALLTDHRYASLAALCPYIDEVIAVNRLVMRDGGKLRAGVELLKLVQNIRRRRFDIAVDFHGFLETQLLIGLSRSPIRCGLHRSSKRWLRFCFNRPAVAEDKSVHVAEMFHRIADAVFEGALPSGPSLVLKTPPNVSERVLGPGDHSRLAGFYAGAGAPDRMWPPQRFARLAEAMIERLDATILLLGGTSSWELEAVDQIRLQCRYQDKIIVPSAPGAAEIVAAISRCRMFISNDTGPMHIGPAVGVPTLGLFSVGYPEHYRPSGPRDRYIQARNIGDITVDAVLEQINSLWTAIGPGR